jgi:hypothetical protein
MNGRRALAIVFAVGLIVLLAAPAIAHEAGEGSGVSIEPSQLEAGGTVVLAGSGLEPDSDRVLQLVGHDLIIQFGTVTTDADGAFATELAIPGYLPAGTYEVQAIGDETLSTPIAVTAAAGTTAASTTDPGETVVARSRSALELAVLGLVIAGALGVGVVLVRAADRGEERQPT